ncbi:MAG: adenylosuccinate synthetase [Nanoarchaeota archaeon]
MVYSVAFVGAQTGDEGKGVRVDYYVTRAVEYSKPMPQQDPKVWTMRWQGGRNAGHTVIKNGEKYALHQIPSGILIPGTFNLMGESVFLEPRQCLEEIMELRRRGVKIDRSNFGIASNAHVTLDYSIEADKEASKLRVGHTSTGQGIKQTAVDKYGRVGIRFQEFIKFDSFVAALKTRFPEGMPSDFGTHEDFANSYNYERDELVEFPILQTDIVGNKNFVYGIGEGAQGFQLDVDRGLYPGVTSSNPSIVPFRTNKVVGVVKMYESSIGGDRPFIGRMETDLETRLRDLWKERGTTTGKDRSLGWLDIVALKNATKGAEIDCLVSTCGDRMEDLFKFGEKVKLVVAYNIDGIEFDEWEPFFHDRTKLSTATPIFEELPAWEVFFDKEEGRLTPNAQRFVNRIEELVYVPFVAHGYGPGIEDVFEVRETLPRN